MVLPRQSQKMANVHRLDSASVHQTLSLLTRAAILVEMKSQQNSDLVAAKILACALMTPHKYYFTDTVIANLASLPQHRLS